MGFNFKFFVRCVGALSYAGIFTHTALTVDVLFGLNATTIIYLLTVLAFYLFVYIYQFHKVYINPEINDFNVDVKEFEKVKLGLLIFNIALTIYQIYINKKPISTSDVVATFFENCFIAFPELLIYLIEKIFKKKDDEDK